MAIYRRFGAVYRAADLVVSRLPAAAAESASTSHAIRPYSATASAFQSSQYYGGGGGGGGTPSRAFPSYSIFGTDALLTMKPMLPSFKPAGGDGVALDRRGRMMLSFTPSSAGSDGQGSGNWLWQEQLTMALTVEEVGLLVNQLPMHEVEISRSGNNNQGGRGGGEYSLAPEPEISDAPDKVLTVTPGDGATVTFTLDFVRDGVGGQLSPLEENSHHAPMEVVAQAGDFEVLKRLMETSIPQLLGWNNMMDIAIESMMKSGGGGGGRPY